MSPGTRGGRRTFSRSAVHQAVVVDRAEERLEAAFHGVAAAFPPAFLPHGHRLAGGAAGTVSVAVSAEARLEKRPRRLRDGLLDHPVQHRRYPRRAFAPVGLRNPRPFDGRGPAVSLPGRFGDPRPVFPREGGEVRDGHPVEPRGALVRLHASPRCGEVSRGEDLPDHGSFPGGSLLPSVAVLKPAPPSGVAGWSVRRGVDPLLVGPALRRVGSSGNFAVLSRTPARSPGCHGLRRLPAPFRRRDLPRFARPAGCLRQAMSASLRFPWPSFPASVCLARRPVAAQDTCFASLRELAPDGGFFIPMSWYSYRGLAPRLQRAHAGHTQGAAPNRRGGRAGEAEGVIQRFAPGSARVLAPSVGVLLRSKSPTPSPRRVP